MNTSSRGKVWRYLLPFFLLSSAISYAEIVVKTFHDTDNDGIQDPTELLITGLSVQGFDELGQSYPFLEDGSGIFILEVAPSRLRIEVTGYTHDLQPGISGPTSVFFAEDGDVILVPVITEAELDLAQLDILVPCYEKGAAEDKGQSPAFVSFPYTASGVAQQYGGAGPNPNVDATIAQIGSTWGVAFQSQRQRAFAATVLKRHVGLGPGGPGAVYTLDYTAPSPTVDHFDLQGFQPSVGPSIDLGAINRNVVSGVIDGTKPYALSTITEAINRASYDIDAFDKIGKFGYGDIDLTEDEKQLWLVNLKQRSLIAFDVNTGQVNVTAASLQHYLIDDMANLPSVEFRYMKCINAGSNSNLNGAESFTDPNGMAWDRNKYTSSGVGDYRDYSVANTLVEADGTSQDKLYHTYRKGAFTYQIPIPKDETYQVTLHFAEPANYQAGDRIFDVLAENAVVLDDFDIVATAGANKTAITVTFSVEATGGTLDLEFDPELGNQVTQAIVAGIKVEGESMMTSGMLRPWGLSFHDGRGYLGLISDASFSQSRDHLFGWVMSFDPSNMAAGFREEVAFPLNYPRERASNADDDAPQPLRTAAWLPWASSWEDTHIPLENEQLSVQNGLLCSYPQPIISDINFTEDGSMIIALMDRWAHQTGYLNYSTVLDNQTLIIGYASGDLVKAFKLQNSQYQLEASNMDDGIYYRDDDGPSYDGEFFYEDSYQALDAVHHGELVTGGTAILPGTSEVAVTVYNPIETALAYFEFAGVYTQGLHFYNTETGTKNRGYLFVDQYNIGKANGLGDMEFALSAPTGEVGNFLWCDANGNGIQDPTEYGIAGIELVLHDKENSLQILDQTTSDQDGEYIFGNLLPDHCYEIRVDLSQLSALGYSGLTAPLQMGGNPLADSDADPSMVPGFAVIMFCTDAQGTNRHDLDLGFGGPRALDVSKAACEDLMGCASFDLSVVADCVDTTGVNEVRFYPRFEDADSMITSAEITGTIRVCDGDTTLYARVNIVDDTACFSIATVTLEELTSNPAPQDYDITICPATTFDALTFLQDQGYRGDGTTELYPMPNMMGGLLANPVPLTSFPMVIYYYDTIDPPGCGVNGALTIDSLPVSSVEAGADTETCGFECIDLTALGASFSANGSGSVQAHWTSSGTGTFVEDNSFAGARLYCPDSADVFAGMVVLRLEVLDDACGRTIEDSVTITIESPFPRFIDESTNDTIDCTHPFVVDQVNNDTFPRCRLVANCGDTITATVIDYRTIRGDCEDIVKLIVRTQRVRYDKVDYFCMDTIFVRGLDFDLFTCPPERDSVYCHSGYLRDARGNPSPLETGVPMAGDIPLWPQPNAKCDVLILYEDKSFGGICPETIHRTWWIKNNCTGSFDTCEQWLMIFDTIGPTLEKDIDKALVADPEDFPGYDHPVILVPTSRHGCEGHTYIPPVMATDTCNDVKMVKVKIADVASAVLTYNASTMQWESHEQFKIPRTDDPILVIYEALDLCHNVTMDTCYFLVKDLTKPVAICDKGVNVTLSDTAVWVAADVFNEGSWDNCGINLVLARRADWATACGVDLCDDIEYYCSTEHHDTIWSARLHPDKHENPIEAHYYETLRWLCEDGQDCNSLVIGGWWYDLMKHATLECVDHPYPVDDRYFEQIWKDATLDCTGDDNYAASLCIDMRFHANLNQPTLAGPLLSDSEQNLKDVYKQIGGGWSKKVPFCCDDACTNVMVELLVMDYWCNWSKCWTMVYVEDKTPPVVVSELFDLSISCTSYQQFYEDAVKQAQDGDFVAIDSLLGGFDKVMYDEYDNLPEKTPYSVYDVRCDSVLIEKDSLHYDEHLGYVWKTYRHYEAIFDTTTSKRYRGQVADDCGLICIEDKPWVSLDECGNGFIKRVFHFVGQCEIDAEGHHVDTLTRHQTIWITSDCDISKSMFALPEDVILQSCGLDYADDGSGNASGAADPIYTGKPEYIFDDHCRQIGIGYYDRVFRIVGGDEACYKIIRTWCFADWCALGETPVTAKWWFDKKYEGKYFSCVQKIILFDTIPPTCTLDIPDRIEVPGCYYTLDTEVDVKDECGVLEYRWELIDDKQELVIASYGSTLDRDTTGSIPIKVKDLGAGNYTLKMVITDDCRNEQVCKKSFIVVASKKPTPICVSLLTLNLNPMDRNNDGVIDTAMGTVWADEFNASSAAPCGSDPANLSFRLERLNENEPALPPSTATSMTFGCADIGPQVLRMYVLSENGDWDFCEVILVVQDNNGGCDDLGEPTVGTIDGLITTEIYQVIHGVRVEVENPTGGLMMSANQVAGSYRFDLSVGQEAYLKPSKESSYVNGVSTRDLIQIQKHILGKETLDSWHKEQAADASGDGRISAIDLIQLRRLILGKIDQLPNVASWRFFNQIDRSESYHINPMEERMRVDFIGVKTGDVNLDSDPALRAPRSREAMVMTLEDQLLHAGQSYEIPVRATDLAGIQGFQFTLEVARNLVLLQEVRVNSTVGLTKESFNLDHMDEGWLTTSWIDPDFGAGSIPKGTILFTLVLQAEQEGRLSDLITINGSRTAAEAYLSQVDLNIALAFTRAKEGTFSVHQNRPNPFHRETAIDFELPEATDVDIRIFDVTGRPIVHTSGFYAKGQHTWSLQAKDLPTAGVYYYQVATSQQSAIRKMILMSR